MLSLAAWIYDSAMGAATGQLRLRGMQRLHEITVIDHASIAWLRGAHRPRLGYDPGTHPATKATPLAEFARQLVQDPGALAARLATIGVDPELATDLHRQVRPGTSVLLVLSPSTDVAELGAAMERGLSRHGIAVVTTQLNHDVAEQLLALGRGLAQAPPPQRGVRGRARPATR